MKPVNLRKLERMAVLSFRNALRLHGVSIALFRRRSFASSYALSVLALEEIGKYHILEDLVWNTRVNGRRTPDEEEAFVRLAYDHRVKQGQFARAADLIYGRAVVERIWGGELERGKQGALYVGLPRRGRKIDLQGRILSPLKVSRRKAEAQITLVNDFVVVLAVGCVKGTLGVDVDEMESLPTLGLAKRLRRRWPRMGRSPRRYVAALERQ